MLRGLWPFVAAIAFAGVSDAASQTTQTTVPLNPGANKPNPPNYYTVPVNYFKPDPSQTSGYPNNNASFSRSPCPALNTLANCKLIRGKGKRITQEALKRAIMTYFKLAEDAATVLVSRVPKVFSLDYFSQSSFNHKASMFHNDLLSSDPSLVDLGLVQNFRNLADSNDMISIEAVAKFRAERTLQCQQSQMPCTLSPAEVNVAFTQAALLLLVFGDGQFISVGNVNSFLVLEDFPDTYMPRSQPVYLKNITDTAAKLRDGSG